MDGGRFRDWTNPYFPGERKSLSTAMSGPTTVTRCDGRGQTCSGDPTDISRPLGNRGGAKILGSLDTEPA